MQHVLLLTLLVVAPVAAAENALSRELLANTKLMGDLAEMVASAAAMNALKAELVAFVVRNDDGALTLVPWGVDRSPLKRTYRGAIPANIVIIVHTHPDRRHLPSPQDMKEAHRLKIGICVLTRAGIWLAHPTSEEPIEILNEPAWTGRASEAVRMMAVR